MRAIDLPRELVTESLCLFLGAVCLWGVPELVNATKFRDVDKETSFGTAYELF